MTLFIIIYLLLGAAFVMHGFYISMQNGESFTRRDIGVAIAGVLIWLPWTIIYCLVQLFYLIKSKIKKK